MENNVGIIILAGGKSTRMGADKGLLLVNGQPIIQYLINTCRLISSEIIIISNQKDYYQFGLPVIKDKVINIGPLGGLYTGLLNSKKELNLVLSCDTPMVSRGLLNEIIKGKLKKCNVIITKHKNQLHPLIGLYSKQVINRIEYLIVKKEYKLTEIYSQSTSMILDLSHFPAKEFLNLNTQKELETFKQIVNDS